MILTLIRLLYHFISMFSGKSKPTPEEIDVDMRFLLANERTLLAWIRTSLALVAAGVAIVNFDHPDHRVYGIAVILVGGLAAFCGYWRYNNADKAIRFHKLSNKGRGPLLITLAVIAIAVGAMLVYAS